MSSLGLIATGAAASLCVRVSSPSASPFLLLLLLALLLLLLLQWFLLQRLALLLTGGGSEAQVLQHPRAP